MDLKHQYYTLVVFRDSANQISARLQVYDAKPDYRLTHENFNVNDFSGLFYQICLDGKVKRVFGILNGRFIHEVILKPNDNRGSRVSLRDCNDYNSCVVESIFESLPSNPALLKPDGTGGATIDFGLFFRPFNPSMNPEGIIHNGGGSSGALGNQVGNTLLSEMQLNQMRTLFYANDLEDLFEILRSTDQQQLGVANSFVKNNNATAIAALKRFTDEGFTFYEFKDLFRNTELFGKANPYLIENNFDADSKDYIKEILKNLKDAKELATPVSAFCSKKDLYDYVKNSPTICPNCNEGQLHDKIGTMFENAWNAWQLVFNVGNYEPNTNDAFQQFSPSRGAFVAPDGFMKSIRHPTLGQLGVDQKAHWIECKASNSGTLGLGDYTGQIKGQIEALSIYQPWACANQMAAVSYVTTIDMIPAPTLINYANGRGIWILQSYASFEIRADGKLYLTFSSTFPQHQGQFGQPLMVPTMAALKQTLTNNYVEFK